MTIARYNSEKSELPRRASLMRESQLEVETTNTRARSAAADPLAEARENHFPTPRLVADAPKIGSRPLRILIADDQLLVRAGICELVKALPDVAIVGEASDGREALRLMALHDPDIVLMDIAMPGMNGLEALVLAKTQFPRVKIIILSEHSNEDFVFRALRSGAEGFVLKDDPVDELYSAINSVAGGGEHLSRKIAGKVVYGYLERQTNAAQQAKRLTPRQQEVLQLIAEGKSTKEIATGLDLSVNTVKTHRLKLMEKIGVHEVAGVVRYAVKAGLIRN